MVPATASELPALGPRLASALCSCGSLADGTRCVASPAWTTSAPARASCAGCGCLPLEHVPGATALHSSCHPAGLEQAWRCLPPGAPAAGRQLCDEVAGARTLQARAGEGQEGAQVARQPRQEEGRAHVRDQANGALRHGKDRPASALAELTNGTLSCGLPPEALSSALGADGLSPLRWLRRLPRCWQVQASQMHAMCALGGTQHMQASQASQPSCMTAAAPCVNCCAGQPFCQARRQEEGV